METRNSFVDRNNEGFTFAVDDQTFHILGEIEGILVLMSGHEVNVKVPEFSVSPNAEYALVQEGALKHLALYEEDCTQKEVVDLCHDHKRLRPHKHYFSNHSDRGFPLTEEDERRIERIKERFNLL